MKKQIINTFGMYAALCGILSILSACHGTAAQSAGNDSSLIAYKNSKYFLYLGFLVDDGNDPPASTNPASSPDSVDFLEFFAGRDTVKANWRTAQAKGTRIVVCYFPEYAYFDGSVNDPATKVPGYVNPPGFNQKIPNSKSTYLHWAQNTYAKD